jgi:hypothetical protein
MRQRRLAGWGLAAGWLLHAAAVAWVWRAWGEGPRAAWLVWMDFPCSLAWLDAPASRILRLSLALGGLLWGVATALLVLLVGRLTARR